MLYFCRKLGKMLLILSSAAVVIGALRVNLFNPNETSPSYQFDQSISVLMAIGCKQTLNRGDPDKPPCSVASDLVLCFLTMSHKKDVRLI